MILEGTRQGHPARPGGRDARTGRLLRRPRAPRPGAEERDDHRGHADGARRARPARVRRPHRRGARLRAQAARRARSPTPRLRRTNRPIERRPPYPARVGCGPCGGSRSSRTSSSSRSACSRRSATIASGILPRVTGWDETSPIGREVFGGVPDPIYWLFYATVPVVLLTSAWLVALRVRNYERGQPDDRRTTKANVAPTARRRSAPACGCARCCATRRPASCTPSSTSGSSSCSRPRSSSRSTTSSPRS